VVEDTNLTVQISALRRILDRGRAGGSCIQTVAGRGYRFVGAVVRCDRAAEARVASTSRVGNGTDRAAGPGPSETVAFGETGGETTLERIQLRKRRFRRPLGVAVGLIVCVLVGAAIAVFWTSGYRWFGREVTPLPRLSIVVLPFTNMSDDREQQYFADGVTGDLTTDLSRIGGGFVISLNTALTYKDKPVNASRLVANSACATCSEVASSARASRFVSTPS
jgi:hypothetical protein